MSKYLFLRSKCYLAQLVFGCAAASVGTAQITQDPATGNIGIGTQTPLGALHINKPGTPPGGLPANQNGLLLGIENINGYKWLQSYGGPLVLNTMGNNVGIGISAPQATLDVGGAVAVKGHVVVDDAGQWETGRISSALLALRVLPGLRDLADRIPSRCVVRVVETPDAGLEASHPVTQALTKDALPWHSLTLVPSLPLAMVR
jgi:hypothetical protein